MIEEHQIPVWHAPERIDNKIDALILQLSQHAGLHVVVLAGLKQLIAAALQRDIGYRRDGVALRLPEAPQLLEPRLALGAIPRPARFDLKQLAVGPRIQNRVQVDNIGRIDRDVAVLAQYITRLRHGPDNAAAQNDRIHIVQLVFDRGDHAEIAATAAQAPVKIGVLRVVRPQEPPIGRHDIERGRVIACQPIAAAQPTDTAPERQPGRAGVRDRAGRGRQPEGGALVVELAEQRTGLDIGALGFRINPHALHRLQIDHQSTVAARLARIAVAARAHRSQQLVLAGKGHRLLDIGGASTAGNQCWLLVERGVPEAARPIVIRAACEQHLAAQAGGQGLYGGAGQHHLAAGKAPCRHLADAFKYRSKPSQRQCRSKCQTRTNEMASFHEHWSPISIAMTNLGTPTMGVCSLHLNPGCKR